MEKGMTEQDIIRIKKQSESMREALLKEKGLPKEMLINYEKCSSMKSNILFKTLKVLRQAETKE